MVEDLSKKHFLLTDLFKWPENDEDWMQYMLTQEQMNHFEEFGYVDNVKVLDDRVIEALSQDLENLIDPEHEGRELFHEYHSNESTDPGKVVFHALGAWRIKKSFHDMVWNPAIVAVARQLLGGDVRFWHDQLFYKPPKHGGVVAWHQDYSYWTRTVPMQHLTCWVGLDDATVENGCLHYIPGSHKWNLLDKTNLAGDMDKIIDNLTDEQRAAFKPRPIELKKGYATFHHPLMLHGSYENKSDKPRRGVVVNMFAGGTRSDSNEPLLPGCPVIEKGKVLEGDFHPLMTGDDSIIL